MTETPRGIRNHNPGNLEYTKHAPFQGAENPPHDADGYYVFKDAEWGLRALMLDLHTCLEHDHLTTVEEIITHYAPPTENDTEAYIAAVLHWNDWQPGHEPDKTDPQTYIGMSQAITVHENGLSPDHANPAWYSIAVYEYALKIASIDDVVPPKETPAAYHDAQKSLFAD